MTEAVGGVSAMLVSAGQKSWRRIAAGSTLSGGDQLRTEKAAKATLTFPDGSRIELGPQSNFTLDEASDGNSMHLGLGSLRAFIKHVVGKRFDVHTPTAVCSVRGTDFIMIVNEQGHTAVQMFTGILAVADHRGNEALLRDGDRLRVTDKGLSSVEHQAAGGTQGPADKLKEVAKREVGLQMSKEQVQAAAAIESKNAIFQEGKAIIDVNGNRVRIEEYIVRPRPTDFKLVVLDSRADRFDYFYYHGVFNQTLPDDISLALRMLPGCIGAACPFFLTSYDTGRSNTIDNMLEVSAGGHMIDVNNDGVAADKVTAAFDPKTNTFVGLTVNNPGVNDPANNQPFFQTLFNTNQLTFNGVMHTSWAPAGGAGAACGSPGNICSMGGAEVAFTNVTTVQNPPACSPPDCTYTEPGLIHQVVFSANGTGTIWDKFDSYIISDTGKVATTADFAGVTSGASYKSTLLKWNFEQIVTASEFHGRKIDLAVEPKIFIESGLIP